MLTIITFIITVAIVFLVNYLNEKIASQKLKDYYNLAKQIVMAIKQLNSELPWEYKKELADEIINLNLKENKSIKTLSRDEIIDLFEVME